MRHSLWLVTAALILAALPAYAGDFVDTRVTFIFTPVFCVPLAWTGLAAAVRAGKSSNFFIGGR